MYEYVLELIRQIYSQYELVTSERMKVMEELVLK